MSNNYNIVWEKWRDPFGYYEENDDSFLSSDHDYDEDYAEYSSELRPKKINAIMTPMGIIPYNEYTDCSKIFNFWIGHTNFNITTTIADIIQSIDGVETLDIFTRYRFRVAFGKAFIDRDIMSNINNSIIKYYDNIK